MQCPECRAENRPGSNFCRTCGYTLPDPQGYVPSVPPPDARPFQDSYQQDSYQAAPPPPTVYQQPPPPVQYTQQPPPPQQMPYAWGALVCPRCASPNVAKAAPPMWAVLLAVILALPTCFISLLFLLVKDPNTCRSCSLQFR